ncbi:MAG: energy transducer TonB [Janthinobacterium lividum]
MPTYFFGFLALFSVGFGSSAMAQRAAGPTLASIAQTEKQHGPAVAATATAAPAAAPQVSPDSVFINPEVRPQFPGGEAAFRAYLAKNIHYPVEAIRQHTTGKVFVSFVLSATGLVTYATVLRGPGSGLNEEALRLVWHMPPWQPARQHGQPVRVSCSIPISFTP